MIKRQIYIDILRRKLSLNPAVVLLGPRQVGKTTLARSIYSENEMAYYDPESPNVLNALKLDIEAFLQQKKDKLIVLDEVQTHPPIFSALRSIIDVNRKAGKFLLLGSAHPSLVKGVSESLAGRISYMELSPLNLLEVGAENQHKHWFRGGFPLAYLAENEETFSEWMMDYIKAYIERDVNLLFNLNLNHILIRRLWTMLAHLNGSLLNSSELGRSLGVSSNTVNYYIEILEGAFLIKRLQPWYANVGKRLVKSPKIYFTDTGLLHTILGIKKLDALNLHPIVGASWENYVIQQIHIILEGKLDMFFYRTHHGSELDLVLVNGVKPLVGIEIKNSNSPTISKGFYLSIEDLKTEYNFIITQSATYFETKGIKICSLADFLTYEIDKILNDL